MQLIVNIIYSGLLYLLFSFSFRILYTSSKYFCIDQAAYISVAPYFLYLLYIQLYVPLMVSILLSITFTVFISLIINEYIINTFKRRGVKRWSLFIVALGIYIFIQNLLSLIFGDNILTFRRWPIEEGYYFLSAHITMPQIIIIVMSCMLLTIVWMIINKTNYGMRVISISLNPYLSEIYGISYYGSVRHAIILSTFLAASAGILVATEYDIYPSMGFKWLLFAVIVFVVAGLGEFRYMFIAAMVLSSLQHSVLLFLNSKWMNALSFFLLLLLLYFKPNGLSGIGIRKNTL